MRLWWSSGFVVLTFTACDKQGGEWEGSPSSATPYDASDRVWYGDADGDHYGDPSSTTTSATQPTGYVGNSLDCDDTTAAISPDVPEVCGDSIDNDCNGLTDSDELYLDPETTSYGDVDGDGYGDATDSVFDCGTPDGYVTNSADCDDTDGTINPAAAEVCDSTDTDEDCDGDVDEADSSAVFTDYYADDDSDTYGDPLVSESACEAPSDAVTDSSDCDDNDNDIYPGATELCDGEDNDCDALVDEGAGLTFYVDADLDNYGGATAVKSCSYPGSGYVLVSGDCDDSDDEISPDAEETCDAVDNDCDGDTDDDDADVTDQDTWYVDADGDGYGDEDDPGTLSCDAVTGAVMDNTDCDDGDNDNHPGGTEISDGEDNDCDGEVDEDDSDTDTDPGDTDTGVTDTDSDTDTGSGTTDTDPSNDLCFTPNTTQLASSTETWTFYYRLDWPYSDETCWFSTSCIPISGTGAAEACTDVELTSAYIYELNGRTAAGKYFVYSCASSLGAETYDSSLGTCSYGTLTYGGVEITTFSSDSRDFKYTVP